MPPKCLSADQLRTYVGSTAASGHARFHLGCGQFGAGAGHFHIGIKGQGHAHAALGKALGFAEQAQVGVGYAQGFVHAVKHNALGFHAAVDHGAGTGGAQGGANGQAQDGAGVQLKFALHLGGQRNQAGVVRAWAHFAEPHVLALHKQLHAKQAQAHGGAVGGDAVQALAQVVGHGLGNLARLFQGGGVHGVGLPAFHVVATHLDVADGVAEVGFHLAVCAQGAHGELGDFVIEVDEAFHNHAPVADAASGHRVVPGGLHIGGAVDLALAFARAAHHGFDDAGVADAGLAVLPGDGGLQLGQRVAEAVGAGGQAQGFGSQAADAFAVHGQAGSAGGGDDAHHPGGFQLLQHGGGNGLNLGHHQVWALGLDQGLELGRVAHGDGAAVVRHLLAGGVVVAVGGGHFHAQALQGNDDFFAKLAAAQQHDFGGVGGEWGAEGGHGVMCAWPRSKVNVVVDGMDGVQRNGFARIDRGIL